MIWCLHGFLGQGSDWNSLRAACTAAKLPACVTPDLFAGPLLRESLDSWGSRFAATVAAEDASPFLLGYSLGGRLALHALMAQPRLWAGAIIISAHCGLRGEEQRASRRRSDEQWALRFETESWETVLTDWNGQPVFAGVEQQLARRETDYDRGALAAALRQWSLGAQTDLRQQFAAVTVPVLWIAGARDPRYVAQGEEAVRYLRAGSLQVAPGAGHRVPWDAEEWFGNQIVRFVRSLPAARP